MTRASPNPASTLPRPDPVVACQGLTKVFKDFWMRDRARAVDNLTFEVRPREVFGLLGPNGSGKSTTIKLLLGLLKPTSGRIAVFGKPPTDVATKKRIGYLPEESYLYPFLNARETLDYYGKLFELDSKVRRRRVDELLEMVGLASAQFRVVREYSKGMQRRIGIAQALINDPDFLILDEPTTGLDPIGTRQIKDLILELGRRGKTILLSSHLLADVEDVVDRMVILYGGRTRAEGSCEDLLESSTRTAVEADTLDDATVAEIDRVIRARSGGAKAIVKVSRPRQTLEELFLKIVEQARAERLETSGAQHGGATASFLRGEPEGDALIGHLVRAADEPPLTPVAPPLPAPAAPAGPDASIIESLTSGGPPDNGAPPAPRPAAAAPAHKPQKKLDTREVDLSVIDSLVERDADAPATPPERPA
ncbi:MAG: ABC transporter ATP-binding protein [Phycisphaerales bacterium]